MDTVLIPDVQRHLMQAYAPDHRVLLSLTCRQFRPMCDRSTSVSPSSSVSVCQLAKHGHYHLLRWILSKRGGDDWSLSKHHGGDWSKFTENALLAAVYPHGVQRVGGPEELLRFVHVVWGVSSIDELMIFAAERRHLWVVQCCLKFWGAAPDLMEAFLETARAGHMHEFRAHLESRKHDHFIFGALVRQYASLARQSDMDCDVWNAELLLIIPLLIVLVAVMLAVLYHA